MDARVGAIDDVQPHVENDLSLRECVDQPTTEGRKQLIFSGQQCAMTSKKKDAKKGKSVSADNQNKGAFKWYAKKSG